VSQSLAIRRVTVRVFRCPLTQPVTTSFGIMRDRPMVLVEVEDRDGGTGWGEVWCNFPAVGGPASSTTF
jgi:D-galactarolactone cycloisomerase